jgi:hypothetical protein
MRRTLPRPGLNSTLIALFTISLYIFTLHPHLLSQRNASQGDKEYLDRLAKNITLVSQLFDGYDKKILFQNVIKSIKKPASSKTVFRSPFTGQRLSIALLCPVYDSHIRYTLWNIAHVYGASDVSLYIFHSPSIHGYIQGFIKDWKNVQMIAMDKNSSFIDDLLINSTFYNTFKSEFVLTMNSYGILKRKVDDSFYKYDYVACPWHESIFINQRGVSEVPLYITMDRRVGNGGFALRKVSKMLETIKLDLPYWPEVYEDQFIVLLLL